MWQLLYENLEQTVSVILFVIGFSILLLQRNLIRKIIGLNIMDTSVYLFLASMGYIQGRKAPIVTDGVLEVTAYINPVPTGLVL
ncbi:MAG TPA: NADH-quinone oxidoreductase subunit K, partial [Clostridia bacterium]|nr:NADH-quinone oxidoreductase subunit K [Clostridia bacterium]